MIMEYNKKHRYLVCTILLCLSLAGATGCGGAQETGAEDEQGQPQVGGAVEESEGQDLQGPEDDNGNVIAAYTNESAKDARVDFGALQEDNPEIFAWIYIPDTEIDHPVLQSMQGDDFYKNHNAGGQVDSDGAIYIELANLSSMCDFNTVMHGSPGTGPFADLEKFKDPDFFEDHDTVYIYLDGNVLTYTIFAAYERENTSLLRSYDFTYRSGCQEFLDDLYGIRDLRMNLRDGWEGVNPYHFLITLTAEAIGDTETQYVVIAVMTQDAAGTINRIVED